VAADLSVVIICCRDQIATFGMIIST
jgi:hypothetical protein